VEAEAKADTPNLYLENFTPAVLVHGINFAVMLELFCHQIMNETLQFVCADLWISNPRAVQVAAAVRRNNHLDFLHNA
jgi:hypothetical protein